MHAITKNKLLLATLLMTVLYALHYGIPLYATSTYLHMYFGSSTISILYVIASIITLLASIHIAKYIKRFHTYQFTLGLVIAEIITTIAFATTTNPLFIGLFFVTHFCLQVLLYICINIFIETFSNHKETGSIRGIFLALLNMGILISPVLAGAILSISSFQALYIVASCILIPFIFFLHRYMSHIEEPAYHSLDMVKAAKRAWKNPDLRGALIAALILECFYSVMIIYSPIYLTSLGIPLTVYLATILPFALLPFVVLPYELGYLADTKIGEKELLILGLIIVAISLFLIVIIRSPDILLWTAVLVVSRIGASFVETMTFTYYFKKIEAEDASLTALFSNMRTLAVVVIGILGFAISPLLVTYPQLIFIILGCAVLLSILSIMQIRDTR
jgi:MFS family permease